MKVRSFIAFLPLLALVACASGLQRGSSPAVRKNSRTVVLFVVDGLGVKALQMAFRQGRMPHTRRFFLRGQPSFQVGQAAFPSLTYPNIASILTTKPLGEQPILANQVVLANGKMVNYEAAETHQGLRAIVDPISVIGELKREGRESASFSYVFGFNAASHMRVGLREGLEYKRQDYEELDGRLLGSFDEFLSERANWPEFIYVHLVGVDGVAHSHGPLSRAAMEYLSWLDQRMGPVLAHLAEADKRKGEVITMLTSDHGFVHTTRHVSLVKVISKMDVGLVVANESRILSLHQRKGKPPRDLEPTLARVRSVRGVEFTAERKGQIMEIANKKVRMRFALGPAVCANEPVSLALIPEEGGVIPASGFRCPKDFDSAGARYPFLIANLARFLTAPNHPDALVVAQPHVSFTRGAKGSHGGPTADEILVPVLLRNARIEGEVPPRTSELLKILNRGRAR